MDKTYDFLDKVRDVDANNSDVVKDTLSKFFQQLPKHTEAHCCRWLRVLHGVITRFPKYCISSRNTIETFLSQFLDCANYYIVIEAAKCAHSLQQVRSPQEKASSAKSCWRDQTARLAAAAHKLLSELFPQAVDVYKGGEGKKHPQPSSPLSIALSRITNVGSQKQNKHAVICNRLRNVFVFLQAMLVETYPVAKPIQPQVILDVIVRALSITSGSNLSTQICDVATVKTQALRSLDALIVCLGSNLIPFSPLVFRSVMQTLKWTTDSPSEESRKVRRAAYTTVTGWLRCLHAHDMTSHGNARWEDELTDHILNDVTPATYVVQLSKMSNQPSKHLSKKAKRKLANTMLQESNIATHMPGEKSKIIDSEDRDDEVAISALDCAETFLTVCGIFLKPATHKRFRSNLVRMCYRLPPTRRALSLLRALHAARLHATHVGGIAHHAMQIYSAGVGRGDYEISKFCAQALLDIKLQLHCSPPSLNFAAEVQPEVQKEKENTKKQISERNIAALESLLGSDKMPTVINKEETDAVITIADEPVNKKPRVEEPNDQISVSSDSEQDIEISDDSDDVIVQDDVEIEETKEDENVGMAVDDVDSGIGGKVENLTSIDNAEEDERRVVESVVLESKQKEVPIYEANTQMPVDGNIDKEDLPSSMEVGYDYPNTRNEKIPVLEKLDGENLTSSNETDDIQITCGQNVISEDLDSKSNNFVDNVPKDSFDKSPKKIVENGDGDLVNDNLGAKNNVGVNVEDMLADFVEEVDFAEINTVATGVISKLLETKSE